MTDAEKRIHAEATFNALQYSRLDLNKDNEAAEVAKELAVPAGLIWLAVDGVDIKIIDELVAWWPRKEA
jgi:hypothetical protein